MQFAAEAEHRTAAESRAGELAEVRSALEQELATAAKTRPDLTALAQAQSAQATAVSAAKSNFGPRVSAYGNWAVDQSDLLIVAGTRFDDRITGDTRHFAAHAVGMRHHRKRTSDGQQSRKRSPS